MRHSRVLTGRFRRPNYATKLYDHSPPVVPAPAAPRGSGIADWCPWMHVPCVFGVRPQATNQLCAADAGPYPLVLLRHGRFLQDAVPLLLTTISHTDRIGNSGLARRVTCTGLLLVITTFASASSISDGMPAKTTEAPLLASLRSTAPGLDPAVLAMALEARDCAGSRGVASSAQRLAVIDYTRPSIERRLWVFDLTTPKLLFAEHVAHGRGSGDNLASLFSNVDGSHQSSLGLFETAETYVGGNGYSLRMDGLEPGVNDHARERAIVMHGAWYVDPVLGRQQGRLGRSYGCPAVRSEVAHQMIDTLKNGQLLFAYYPDGEWLKHSRLLGCRKPAAGGTVTRGASPP